MRQSASRPTYGDESRFVTSAWSGMVGVVLGGGDVLEEQLEERFEATLGGDVLELEVGIGGVEGRPAGAGVAVHDREVDLVLVGVEVEEQLFDLVDDLRDPGVGRGRPC